MTWTGEEYSLCMPRLSLNVTSMETFVVLVVLVWTLAQGQAERDRGVRVDLPNVVSRADPLRSC